MNRIRQFGALLLAIVLLFSAMLQPGIGGAFAVDTEQTGQITEPMTEPEGGGNGTDVDAIDPVCSCGGADGVHAEGCPLYTPVCTCGSEDGTHTVDCPMYIPTCTCGSEGIHAEDCPLYALTCICGTENDTHAEDCPLYVPTEPVCTCGSEDGVHAEECPLYTPACTCGSEDGVHTEECPLYTPACTCGSEDGTHTEECPLYAPACTCGSEDGVHTEECPLYTPACTCGSEDGVHTEECPLYAPACTCGSEDGVHAEECPLYVPTEPVCTCGSEDGVHAEDCPLYTPAVSTCPECGKTDGHEETCSQYTAEPEGFPWGELSGEDFAAWLMDEANAETVKAILDGEGGEAYDALNVKINEIFSGGEEALVQQVWAYLTALTGMDKPELLPDTAPVPAAVDDYIYFDLAAGNVTIGKNNYNGYVYVAGVKTPVSATSRTGTEKFYIYQSNPSAAEDSPTHPNNTGYETNDDFTAKTGCRVPVYKRVENDGKPWTEYITNNSDVYAVSRAWETAAASFGRTATKNYITFAEASNYTADVTIDNIWSSYFDSHGTSRTSGGIGANLRFSNVTILNLWLKGDNRVGCVHYSAEKGHGNEIHFRNGEDLSSTAGSITAGDFPTNWNTNHWNAVIGAADSDVDRSDGIVIDSGVIWAGATVEENCSAIGGGGNAYGGVTINGGTVTAVTAGTGTAIGGGLGVSSPGGDTDVIINGGEIYAYNFGVQYNKGQITHANFIPAAAIGGGGSQKAAGNKSGNVTINGGFIYAQSTGGPAIGGGSSADQDGGDANININGGTIIAKSIQGTYRGKDVSASVGIGGGTGKNAGGSVTLTITEDKNETILRTGSIGGGLATSGTRVGSANVTITGGDITGQVVMAGGTGTRCTFDMSGGRIHGTNLIDGNTIESIEDPRKDVKIQYLYKDGGAVWMEDPNGVTTISGGKIDSCTANLGGAIYMTGGKFTLSGTGEISDNTARATFDAVGELVETGRGGAIDMTGGEAFIEGGTINNCTANLGGAVYMTGGKFTMSSGTIRQNTAKPTVNAADVILGAGRGGAINMTGGEAVINGGTIEGCTATLGGAVYMRGGSIAMSDGRIANNTAAAATDTSGKVFATGRGGGINMIGGNATVSGGTIEGCTANLGGGVYMARSEDGESGTQGGVFTMTGGTIRGNTATGTIKAETGRGGGVCVYGGDVHLDDGSISSNKAETRGGGLCVYGGNVHIEGGSIDGNEAVYRGGGVFLEDGDFTMDGGAITGNKSEYRGGGLFLTRKPTLNGGVISGNTALGGAPDPDHEGGTLEGSGGGLCVKGDSVELTSPEMKIFGNQANNGGGVAVLNGEFILSGGNVGVEGEKPNTATKGGGVYVANDSDSSVGDGRRASVTVYSGNIWYNEAADGGGVYLAAGDVKILGDGSISHNTAKAADDATGSGGGVYLAAAAGDFLLEGEQATISHNTARRGGGAYLHKDPGLNQGRIEYNTATLNGGGLYISDCLVTLNPTLDVYITQNRAENGGGIYIHDSTPSSGGGSPGGGGGNAGIDAISSATIINPGAVGLLVDASCVGTVNFTNNEATLNGGAVCVNAGRFQLESDHITITDNHAKNGGGVAVLDGYFTMKKGSIGGAGGANTAENGGGVYVSGGEIRMDGGSVQYNQATDGGGAYVTGGTGDKGGWLIMAGGAFTNNTAERNGGGGYAAGDFHMLGGTIGGSKGGNRAAKGGGMYIEQGNATIVDGTISHNYAEEDGGGICITSTSAAEPIAMEMLSGVLSYNQAAKNGGGLAVEGSVGQTITVRIGCLLDHKLDAENKPNLPIDYTGDYAKYATYDDISDNHHNSCPKVEYNEAGEIGGAFYLNSADSTLSFYCVEEANNKTLDPDAADTEVVGGKIIIGDDVYHNREYDAGSSGKKHGNPWGYVSMEDAAKVNGGQVDLYGNMINPIFKEDITVDIQNDKDHFIDHRLAEEDATRYKIHYFENFDNAGLYRAFQYNEGNTKITIQSALFSQPGYTILGWSTTPVYDKDNKDCHYYPVGMEIDLANDEVPGMGEHVINCDFCKDHKDGKLLVLYAIWEANGYTVKFDPNVPQGTSYTGKMENKILTYGKTEALPENAYKYPGHFFAGWNTQADGKGKAYGDKEEVLNLTNENGVKITLYAQWKVCDHKDSKLWTYDLINDGKTLRRTCACGGQTLTATLSAEDTVYDSKTHPAALTVNSESDWGTDKPTIKYTAAWLDKEDDGLSHPDGTKPDLSADGKPLHAGKYKATITKYNGTDKVEISVEYTIAKADQEAPEKPEYEVADNKTQLNITPISDNADTKAKAQYRLTYYSGSNLVEGAWQTVPDGSDKLSITMDKAWTSYNVEARYEELEDYNPSEIVKADAVYNYVGDVTVKIICDEGISDEFKPTVGADGRFNGATLNLTTQEGYYLIGEKYEVTATLQEDGKTPVDHLITGVEDKTDEYSVTNVPDNSTLTITVGKARKEPTTGSQVAPGQVFAPFTGTAAVISRDSAFTAAFQIKNYDPVCTIDGTEYGIYTNLKLSFGSNIPQDTTIILVDRSNTEKTYWYYRAPGDVNSVALTAFKKMGGSEGYSIPQPEKAKGYVDLNYQFIVDFSQSGSGYSGDSLTMTLEAAAEDTAKAPEIKPAVTVTMKNSTFTFTKTDANGLTNSFTCSFGTEGSAAASKWEDRASALVLTPKTGVVLPQDARIKAEVAGGGTTYLYKSGNSFIVPLSLLEAGEKVVSLTLESDLFPAEGASYAFTAEWRISPSEAGKAPMNGDQKGSKTDVTFTSSAKEPPSLKIAGQHRVLESGQVLDLTIGTQNMDGYTVSATLLHKLEGAYSGTGWSDDTIKLNAGGNSEAFNFGKQASGSYCLMLTVKEEADSITVVMEVPYYFVIK